MLNDRECVSCLESFQEQSWCWYGSNFGHDIALMRSYMRNVEHRRNCFYMQTLDADIPRLAKKLQSKIITKLELENDSLTILRLRGAYTKKVLRNILF